MDIQKLKAAQKLLAEWSYDWHPIERGYNNCGLTIGIPLNEDTTIVRYTLMLAATK